MARNILLVVALTLLYIFLLTVIFENFVNRPSSTMLTLVAFLLFILLSFLYAQFVIKTFRKRIK